MERRRKHLMVVNHLDPVVREVMETAKIDPIWLNRALLAESVSEDIKPHPQMLFETLLIARHPRILESVKKIKKKLGLTKPFRYPELGVILVEFWCLKDKKLLDTLDAELDKFFSNEGKNMTRRTWDVSIKSFILTEFIPLPPYEYGLEFFRPSVFKKEFEQVKIIGSKQFGKKGAEQVGENAEMRISKDYFKYPLIVIRERITSMDSIVNFIKVHYKQIEKESRELPKRSVKRIDVDLTKLSIGLWLIGNEHKGIEWILKEVTKKYNLDSNYFGKYSPVGREVFPEFKSDALNYLNRLYPL